MIGKVRAIANESGFRGVLSAIIRKSVRLMFHRETLLVFCQHERAVSVEPLCEITIRELILDDQETIASFLEDAIGFPKHNSIQSRFSRGGKCFAALDSNERLVGICWGIPGGDWVPEVAYRVALDKNEIIISDAVTHPDFRGNRIWPTLLSLATSQYLQSGHSVYVGCMDNNKASLSGIGRAGYRLVNRVTRMWVVGRPLPLIRRPERAKRSLP